MEESENIIDENFLILQAGVSLPLWLSPPLHGALSSDKMMLLLSGALTVGIGNAVTYLAYIQVLLSILVDKVYKFGRVKVISP